jgi:GTPase SAR1 family protein
MGFLLIFDVTNESSFLSVQDWLTTIDTYTRVDAELRPPILLIGNKIDLATNRIIDTIRAQQLANELEITYIETSAVTGTNVQETIKILIEHIFQFMARSMQKFYPKQISISKFPVELKHQKKTTSIKLINKLSRKKKQSCPCL